MGHKIWRLQHLRRIELSGKEGAYRLIVLYNYTKLKGYATRKYYII